MKPFDKYESKRPFCGNSATDEDYCTRQRGHSGPHYDGITGAEWTTPPSSGEPKK